MELYLKNDILPMRVIHIRLILPMPTPTKVFPLLTIAGLKIALGTINLIAGYIYFEISFARCAPANRLVSHYSSFHLS